MGLWRKRDNLSLAAKLQIRRWLLDAIACSTVRVLDTCSGEGHIWRAMAAHVTVDRWTRCDVDPRNRPGVLQLTAEDAVMKFPLAQFNVIDIDPYGEPWAAYQRLLPRLPHPMAV